MLSSVPMDTLEIVLPRLPLCFHLSLWVYVLCLVTGSIAAGFVFLPNVEAVVLWQQLQWTSKGNRLPLARARHPGMPGQSQGSEPGGGCKMQPALFRCSTPIVRKKKILCSFSCPVSLIPLILVPKGKLAFRGRREIKLMGKDGELSL